MKKNEEREELIMLLESCINAIVLRHGLAKYVRVLMGVCFPHADTFVMGRTPCTTMRWVFRSASFEYHVEAILLIAFC
jgi:hypothetical protein